MNSYAGVVSLPAFFRSPCCIAQREKLENDEYTRVGPYNHEINLVATQTLEEFDCGPIV